MIQDNVVEGGSARARTTRGQHDNAPEMILTEAYRLHFEGKPAVDLGRRPGPGHPRAARRAGRDRRRRGDPLRARRPASGGRIAQPIGPAGLPARRADRPRRPTPSRSPPASSARPSRGTRSTAGGAGSPPTSSWPATCSASGSSRNHLLGGGEAIRLLATPTEEPGPLGMVARPVPRRRLRGEHPRGRPRRRPSASSTAPAIKSNKGRVYMTLALKDNTLRWTKPPTSASRPAGDRLRRPASTPRELLITEEGTRVEGAPARRRLGPRRHDQRQGRPGDRRSRSRGPAACARAARPVAIESRTGERSVHPRARQHFPASCSLRERSGEICRVLEITVRPAGYRPARRRSRPRRRRRGPGRRGSPRG